jgi:penicillin-binding protein 2
VLPSQRMEAKRFAYPRSRSGTRRNDFGGIGQGYNAYTPMQLAHATAIGGQRRRRVPAAPRQADREPATGEERSVEPQPVRTVDVKPEHIDVIKRALVGVNKEGTGARAFAGAEYTPPARPAPRRCSRCKGEKYVRTSSTSAARPRVVHRLRAGRQPRIALAVLVENGGFGAQAAAPIARQVFDYYLLGKKPGVPAVRGRRCEDDSE